jgi:hypothetical protein
MRRLLVLLAGAAAALTFTVATAAAQGTTYTLQFAATPAAINVGDSTTLHGAIVADPSSSEDLSGYDVEIATYNEPTCSSEGSVVGYLTTVADGSFAGTLSLWGVRTYYFDAAIVTGDLEVVYSDCVGVAVTLPGQTGGSDTETNGQTLVAEPPHFGGSYLCWNREMIDPVAYDDPVADVMWQSGKYFEPQAIFGNVLDGTNIGAYHLVCNAPSTMVETELGVGGSGEIYDAAAMTAYHHEHAGGNDLNVYHIWK